MTAKTQRRRYILGFFSKIKSAVGRGLERARYTTALGVNLKLRIEVESHPIEVSGMLSRNAYAEAETSCFNGNLIGHMTHHVSPQRFTYTLKDVVVLGPASLVFKGDSLVAESSSWPAYRALISNGRLRASKKGEVEQRSAVVLPQSSYYHWLTEDLPAFLAATKCAPDAQIWTHSEPPTYVADFISEFLPYMPKFYTRSLKAQAVTFTGKNGIIGYPQTADILALREFFEVTSRVPKDALAVYVSRRKASRSPLGELELEERLSSIGVSVLNSEHISLGQQIETFKLASLVIGPHGAGLANSLFMPQGHVIELTNARKSNDCIQILAQKCGHAYTDLAIGDELDASAIAIVTNAVSETLESLNERKRRQA